MSRIGAGGIALTGTDESVAFGDTTLPIMVYRPKKSDPVPAVILCPGGVGAGMFEIVEWLAAALRDAGIMAVTVSWRSGSPEHDPDDVQLVKDWLADQPDVIPDRIGIMGMSRGGNATLRAAALVLGLKTVVTFGPVTNLLQQAEGTALYAPTRHRMLVGWLGDPVSNRAFYEKVQAISYADRIKQPLLMVHGQHDMHCPPEQSIWMKEAIERAGNTNVRLELIPMMGHYGDVVPNSYGFETLIGIIVPFFQDQL